MDRKQLIKLISDFYIIDRLKVVDSDFLEFEEEMASVEDLTLILEACRSKLEKIKVPNPHNSIILYLTGLSDEFDFDKARSDTVGGAPPDIDLDFDAYERYKAIQWVVEHWGEENVAHIITHGTLKPKSIIRRYFSITEKPSHELNQLLKEIPPPKHGKEPTFSKVLEDGQLINTDKYTELRQVGTKLENLVSNFGVHAAGIVISDFPLTDVIPLWAKKDDEIQENGTKKKVQKRVTQFDMKEIEELGLIKFDFLGIDNLSIIKETVRLLKEKGIEIDPYQIPDGDRKAYQLLSLGLLTGIFQMETSDNAKRLILDIMPSNIGELSDISALNRPGPIQGGLDRLYIENKRNGHPPEDMPKELAKILEPTYWTLVYQEQVMKICTELAGFSLQEADDIRRAMGKKKADILAKWQQRFIDGIVQHSSLPASFAEELWLLLAGDPNNPDDNGFADYCLTGDTKVLTKDGVFTIKEIVDNKLKLDVQSYLLVDNKIEYRSGTICQWHDRGSKEVFEYHLENGSSIVCTPDHKFLTKLGYMLPIDFIYENNLELFIAEN